MAWWTRVLGAAALTAAVGSALQAQSSNGGSGDDAARDSAATQRLPRPVRWGTGAWLPRLRLDNDAYNFWIHPGHRTDEEYSNGVVASLEALHAPWWGRRFGGGRPGCGEDTSTTGRCLTTIVSLGQSIYTPNLNRPPYSYPGWEQERPYAGWLYLAGAARTVSPRALRQIDVTLGVTGKPALGQTAQSIAHWINRKYTTEATGWETQVGFVPGIQVGWRQSLLAVRVASGAAGWLDLAPSAGIAAGTVRTAADAGVRLRLGYNLSHPWDPRAWRGRAPIELYASAGARTEYVARDVSLDGAFGENERRVERVPGVREYDAGVGIRLRRLRFDWIATTRSREYTTGPSRHVYSTMAAAWEFVP
jgi:hypothetical protein